MNPAILSAWKSRLMVVTNPYSRTALHSFRPWGDAYSPLGLLAESAHRSKVCDRVYNPFNGGWEYDGLEVILSQRIQLWADLSHVDMAFISDLTRHMTSFEEVAAVLGEHTFTPYELPIETEYYQHA